MAFLNSYRRRGSQLLMVSWLILLISIISLSLGQTQWRIWRWSQLGQQYPITYTEESCEQGDKFINE